MNSGSQGKSAAVLTRKSMRTGRTRLFNLEHVPAALRAEPKAARLVLRRLVGPLRLWDESERPEWIKWEAVPTVELLDGLATPQAPSPTGFVTSRNPVFSVTLGFGGIVQLAA